MCNIFRLLTLFFLAIPSLAGAHLYILPLSKNPVVDLIKKARHSIDGCVYKLEYEPIVEALCAKARSGVRVRLLVEKSPFCHDSGTDNAQTPIVRLEKAGVIVDVAPQDAPQRHAKCLVVDGKQVMFTTANFDTETFLGTQAWRQKGSGGDAPTRDIMLVDDDPKIVSELQAWLAHVRDFENTTQPSHPVLAVGPYISTRNVIEHVIEEAQLSCRIWQQSIQDEEIVERIIQAQKRGVIVEIVMTQDPFHKGDDDPNKKMIQKLTQAGVSIYQIAPYKMPYIHMKGVLIDEKRFLFTTTNFYAPSLDEGIEISFWVTTPSVVNPLKNLFVQDKQAGRRVTH